MDTKECDILIIGGGPAGLTAAMYGARAGHSVIVLERLGVGGQILTTPEIENFPGFVSVSGAELATKMSEQAEMLGVETLYDEIESVDLLGKVVQCASVKVVCKAMIIATGVYPRKIGAENEERFIGAGVHFCALCDGAFYAGKDVIVAGGGNSAVEEAIYMSSIAKSVTVVNNLQDFTAQKVLVERLLKLSNITIRHGCEIAKILGDSKVEGVEISDGSVLPCAGVFVAVGRTANTQLFDVEKKDGFIVVNSKLQTSVCGVFAAGDVTYKMVRQVVTACADGAVAATHAGEYIKTWEN